MPVAVKGPAKGPLFDFFQHHNVGFYATNWKEFEDMFPKMFKVDLKEMGKRGRRVIKKEYERRNSNKKALSLMGKLVA